MAEKHKKIPCPCCRNKRLFDVIQDSQTGRTKVDIKCPTCRNLIRITIMDQEVRTEQIDA